MNEKEIKSPVLQAEDVGFSYENGKNVFHGVSFTVHSGESFTILGANGAGKSTLLNCISGLYKPASGTIRVEGENISSLPDSLRAKKIAYVSQNQNLAFDFTGREYLLMGRTPFLGAMRQPGAEEYDVVENVMDRLGISHLAEKSMKRISGGERQQIQIARALVQQPDLILLDEPTNHLDYGNQVKILELIMHLTSEENKAVVLTTHVPDHPILLEGSVGILGRDGAMHTGAAAEIVTEENLQTIYSSRLHMVYVPELGRKACLMGSLR